MLNRFTVGLALAVVNVGAATWYAAQTGTTTNGTRAQPWSVDYSITNSQYLFPGDTVRFLSGSYTCTVGSALYNTTNVLMFSRSGTVENPITYRADTLWGFSFNGGLVVPYGASNLVVRDLRIYFDGMTNRTRTIDEANDAWPMPGGIQIYGSNVVVMHNLIENTGHPAIGSWGPAGSKYIAGNICRFNGFYDNPPSTTVGARGNAGYYQSDAGTTNRVTGQISYYVYTEATQITQGKNQWTVDHTISYACPYAGHNYYSKNEQPATYYFLNNYVFNEGNTYDQNGPGAKVGDNTYPGNHQAYIQDNWLVGGLKGLLIQAKWTNLTVTGNKVLYTGAPGDGGSGFATEYVVIALEATDPGFTPNYTIGANTYYVDAASAHDFQYWGSPKTYAQWTASSGDSGSTFNTDFPTDLWQDAFTPSTDSNFVHVAVFNWPQQASTTVDLSSFFTVGSVLSIYDAQNIPTAFTNITYQGGSVTLPLNLTDHAEMLGEFPTIDTPWDGFDPRFRAFVIYKSGTGSMRSSTLRVSNLKGR